MLDRLRIWFLNFIHPFLVISGKIELPHNLVTGDEYFAALNLIKIGDVLCSRHRFAFTNMIIPGFFKHVAMYVGVINGKPTVIEAIGTGVRLKTLAEFMLTKDYVIITRGAFVTEQIANKAVEKGSEIIGLPYDYELRSGNKTFYCAEVPWYCYNEAMMDLGLGECPFEMKEHFGQLSVAPDDYIQATKLFPIVYDTRGV